MVAQTCAPPECVGPVAAPDALFAPALREARGRSWRASGRRGPPPRGGRARWASPPVATGPGPGTGLGVIALEGLRGSRRPGASAWVAFERPDGWHACEAASRPGSRSAVRVDAEAPVVTRLFEQGPPGVTVALHFSEGWRERRFDYFVWHEHVAACVLGGDVPACFGSVETESGWSESDGEGASGSSSGFVRASTAGATWRSSPRRVGSRSSKVTPASSTRWAGTMCARSAARCRPADPRALTSSAIEGNLPKSAYVPFAATLHLAGLHQR
jgi:hypothetical protein